MKVPGGIKENAGSSVVSLSLCDVGHAFSHASLAFHYGVAFRDRLIASAARSLLCPDGCNNRWSGPRSGGARAA
jgi:hypothetical protein